MIFPAKVLPVAGTGLTRPDGSPLKILVVDDELSLSELLARALGYEGWDVHVAGDGHTALALAQTLDPDAIVLDIMLPGVDGLEVVRRFRATGASTPILLFSAKDSVEDRVEGFTAGADDYVTKPFSLAEMTARIRALARRSYRVRTAAAV